MRLFTVYLGVCLEGGEVALQVRCDASSPEAAAVEGLRVARLVTSCEVFLEGVEDEESDCITDSGVVL